MKISIITVCLNSEETIEKTINSVLCQEYKEIEYIIVDGGSTDKTLKIIEEYGDSISKVISEPDRGLYDAMNKGIRLATGDVIGIINSDDWYEENTFQIIKKAFEDKETGLVYGRMNVFSGGIRERVLIPTDIQKLYYEMEVPHPTVFVRREIYEMYGVFDEQYSVAADYDLILKLYVNGVKFKYIESALANFRTGGISCKRNLICAKETLEISQKYFQKIPQEKKEYISEVIKEKGVKIKFMELLEEKPECLSAWLREKCEKNNWDRVAIFGCGKWGLKMKQVLNDTVFCPEFIVDNNPSKWNTYVDATEITSLEKLKTFCGLVLIMVRDYSKVIYEQVNELKNPNLECVRWEEIAEEL